jgi:hypothetical protein
MWWPGINRQHPLARGLTHAWPMWEGSGLYTEDIVGKTAASFVNMTAKEAWGASTFGSCIRIETSGDYINAGDPAVLLNSALGTISMWATVNWDYDDGVNHYFWDTSTNRFLLFKQTDNTLALYTNSSSRGTGTYTFSAGELVNLTVHWPENKLWVNGRMTIDFTDGNLGSPTGTFFWGARNTAASILNGRIHQVLLYNRALPELEIVALAGDPWAMFRLPSIARFGSLAAPSGQPMMRRSSGVPGMVLTGRVGW